MDHRNNGKSSQSNTRVIIYLLLYQVLGYQRTLQVPDLWKMDKTRQAATLSAKLDEAWARRTKEAQNWNERLANGEIHPSLFMRSKWAVKSVLPVKNKSAQQLSYSERTTFFENQWRTSTGLKEPSLSWALNDVFGWHFWAGGLFKVGICNFHLLEVYLLTQSQVLGDTSQMMCPLLVKVGIQHNPFSCAIQ